MLAPGLNAILSCLEGQETPITAESLRATDADTPDSSLLFLVARQPSLGAVVCRGHVVDRFVQAEVVAGTVSYRHTGESAAVLTWPVHPALTGPRFAGPEVGLAPRRDTVTFVVSDEDAGSGGSRAGPRDSLLVYDLHVSIVPVDSQSPSLTAGELRKVPGQEVGLVPGSGFRRPQKDGTRH